MIREIADSATSESKSLSAVARFYLVIHAALLAAFGIVQAVLGCDASAVLVMRRTQR